jgi:bilirubin oxidase
MIENGDTWRAEFTIMNEAATYFYHPHLMDKTGEHVYRGLAGLFIIKDPENALALPDQYGIDDIPLITQDKSFGADGSLEYDGKNDGVKGDIILVNGAITPKFQAPAQLVRFRVLNASNARIYNVGFSDDRQFHQIATDGGLLAEPVPLTRLLLSPGERAEIVVDFGGQEGKQLRLVSFLDEMQSLNPFWVRDALDKKAFDVLTIGIKSPTARAISAAPDTLARIVRLKESQATKTRKFVLKMPLFGGMTINGQSMDINRIDQTVKLGDIEIWEIFNPTEMFHPFHIHDIQFQILTRNGQPPPENERGWKDTVLVKQKETVRVIAQYSDFAGPDVPYMFHCHILEHEDAGMMGQFVVV